MPKLAQSRTEKQDAILRGALKRIQGTYNKTNKEMAAIIDCSEKTYRKRYKQPGTFTFQELRNLNSRGWLTVEEKASIF